MEEILSNKIRLKVWKRDCWTCRYCGNPVFFAPTLKLLNEINPNHGYYHSHGKNGKILSLFQWGWASVDHINPKSKGGKNSLDNYVTACWKCNLTFNDKTKKEGKAEPMPVSEIARNINWDGFSSLYPKLNKRKDEWTKILS